jgi:hypothetical protein
MTELGGDCDCGDFDGCAVMTVVMVAMMMLLVLKVVKVNIVIKVVVLEEEIVGSIFRVKTTVTGWSETWIVKIHSVSNQRTTMKLFTNLKLSNFILL